MLGIAGPVENNKVTITNVPGWEEIVGETMADDLRKTIPNFSTFDIINDFAAAGLGVACISPNDVIPVNDVTADPNGVRIVTGPGTGYGQAFLVKSSFGNCYEVYPCEGGHVDFPARSQEDFELMQFAYTFVETSENIENQRGKCKPTRMSIERLCAGPAIPLIYEFYKTKYPEQERTLESGADSKRTNDIESKDIVTAAFRENPDFLCRKTIEKFAEILAVEVGNHALKTLPFGGVFLVGGVTAGISDLILKDKRFIELFCAKGRIESTMKRIPVFFVKPEVELGLLGAEEQAFRRYKVFA